MTVPEISVGVIAAAVLLATIHHFWRTTSLNDKDEIYALLQRAKSENLHVRVKGDSFYDIDRALVVSFHQEQMIFCVKLRYWPRDAFGRSHVRERVINMDAIHSVALA